MNELFAIEIVVSAVSSILFFLVSFSGYRHKTRVAAAASIVATLALVGIDRTLWANSGSGLLDHLTCAFVPEARPCNHSTPSVERSQISIVPRSVSTSKDSPNSQNSPQVPSPGLPASERPGLAQPEVAASSIAAVKASDGSMLKPIPGTLSPQWLRGGLYGSDNYVAALKKVEITGSRGNYRVYIENQSGFTCDLGVSSGGDPAFVKNCKSNDYNKSYTKPNYIALRCRNLKNERVCAGDYSLDSRFSGVRENGEPFSGVSEFPGTITIARH